MFYYQRFNQYFAQVAGGLEQIAANELKALGATDGEILTRGIHFKADRETLYRINYRSRLVTRVLAPLIKFEATTPEELYLGAKKVDWTNIFTLDQTFAVFANTFHSEIDHSQYASLKVKDCVVDMFRKLTGRQPSENEQTVLKTMFDKQKTYFAADAKRAEKYLGVGDVPRNTKIDPTQLAALTAVANTLLNFDESVMKR